MASAFTSVQFSSRWWNVHTTFTVFSFDYTARVLPVPELPMLSVIGNKHYFFSIVHRGYVDYPYMVLWQSLTEPLFFSSLFPDAEPTSLRVGTADITFTTCTRKLGFMISDNLSLDGHASTVCYSACVKIRRIGSIHKCLTNEDTQNSRLYLCSLKFRQL